MRWIAKSPQLPNYDHVIGGTASVDPLLDVQGELLSIAHAVAPAGPADPTPEERGRGLRVDVGLRLCLARGDHAL